MKISQFSDREVLIKSLMRCSLYLSDKLNLTGNIKNFVVFPRLNLICPADIDPNLFILITREYRYNRSRLMRLAAYIYISSIYLAFLFRAVKFFFRKVEINAIDNFPVILGGNNRFRFINSTNTMAIVVSKNISVDYFSMNSISASNNQFIQELGLMPKVMRHTSMLCLEEQVPGISINRLKLSLIEQDYIDLELNKFFLIQKNTAISTDWNVFLKDKVNIFNRYCVICKSPFLNSFIEVCELLNSLYSKSNCQKFLDVSFSHGDLNHGNILFSPSRFSIIDWEYFDNRYVAYDRVIYSFNLRHLMLEDYEKFINTLHQYDFNGLAFLVEELLFRCLNFKPDVLDSSYYVEILIDVIKVKYIAADYF